MLMTLQFNRLMVTLNEPLQNEISTKVDTIVKERFQ